MRCELVMILLLSFLLISRGDDRTVKASSNDSASKLSERKDRNPSDTKDDVEVVDPDSFSKGFSTPTYKTDSETEEKAPIDWNEFYREGSLATNLFTPGEYASKKAPTTSAAEAVSDGKRYSWLPKWRYAGVGGVDLPGCALSPDASLLVILETIHPKSAPASTLIVMINTYNWTVESIRRYRGRMFSNIKFISRESANPEIAAWERPAKPALPGHLRAISLKNGRISSSTEDVQASGVTYAVAPSGDYLVLKTDAGTNALYIFSLSDLNAAPRKITTKQKKGVPAISPDSSLVALAGPNAVEVFTAEDLSVMDSVKHSLDVSPDRAIFTGDGMKFALSAYSHHCELLAGGEEKVLCDHAGRVLFFAPSLKRLVFEEYKNGAVTLFDLDDLSRTPSFNPMRTKPKTRGRALFISWLPHSKRFVELDSKGNLFLFHKPGRKWRKKMIFSAKR